MSRSEELRLVRFRPAHLGDLEPPVLSAERLARFAAGYRSRGPGFSLLENGRAIACAGLILLPDGAAPAAFAWAVLSRRARARPVALHRRVMRCLTRLRARHRLGRIVATVPAGSMRACRWLERLGFARRAPLPNHLGTTESYARYELT